MQKIYYIVRWYDNQKKVWYKSTMQDYPTAEQAEEQLKADRAYFYNDIQIELVEVTERVMQVVPGNNKR